MEKTESPNWISRNQLLIHAFISFLSPVFAGLILWFSSFLYNSATKDDLEKLRTELKTDIAELRTEIAELRTDLTSLRETIIKGLLEQKQSSKN